MGRGKWCCRRSKQERDHMTISTASSCFPNCEWILTSVWKGLCWIILSCLRGLHKRLDTLHPAHRPGMDNKANFFLCGSPYSGLPRLTTYGCLHTYPLTLPPPLKVSCSLWIASYFQSDLQTCFSGRRGITAFVAIPLIKSQR